MEDHLKGLQCAVLYVAPGCCTQSCEAPSPALSLTHAHSAAAVPCCSAAARWRRPRRRRGPRRAAQRRSQTPRRSCRPA